MSGSGKVLCDWCETKPATAEWRTAPAFAEMRTIVVVRCDEDAPTPGYFDATPLHVPGYEKARARAAARRKVST